MRQDKMLSVMEPNIDLRPINYRTMQNASPLFHSTTNTATDNPIRTSMRENVTYEPCLLFTNNQSESYLSKTHTTETKSLHLYMGTPIESPSFSLRSPYFGSSLSSSLSFDQMVTNSSSPHATRHHVMKHHPIASMSVSPHYHFSPVTPLLHNDRVGEVISPHPLQIRNMTNTNSGLVSNPHHHGNELVYQVHFKFAVRYCTSNTTHHLGDFVVVNMNPGSHIGIVSEIYPMSQYIPKLDSLRNLPFIEPEDVLLHHIQSIATMHERQQLPEKYQSELNIQSYVEKLTYVVHKLPMIIHGVEFQFDKTKLTIYYSAECRIDFRDLVKNIFAMCKIRIWMKRISRESGLFSTDAVQVALATGMTIGNHQSTHH